jgi:hypothetical protein
LERLPNETLQASFVQELASAAGGDDPPWTLDYTRLNLRARRPS